MEYCPEVAVLESAFQLVAQQAGKCLATIEKNGCHGYATIIHIAVQEICVGLESDRDETDSLLWQQNLHTMILYSLVQKRYIDKDNEDASKDRVPVCSTLDILVQTVPDFSHHFYFEILKLCSWEPLFFESLHQLDSKVSVPLLHDALQHMTSDPVTPEDEKFVTMVTDELLSGLLCVPVPPNSVTEKLLLPLCEPQRFVRVVHCTEDETDSHTQAATGEECRHGDENRAELAQRAEVLNCRNIDGAHDVLTQHETEMEVSESVEVASKVNDDIGNMVAPSAAELTNMWAVYVRKHSDLLTVLLEHVETMAANYELSNTDSEMFGVIGKLLMLGLLCRDEIQQTYESLILNLWGDGSIDSTQMDNGGKVLFCLNIDLAKCLSKIVDRKQWAFCVYKMLTTLSDRFAVTNVPVAGNANLQHSEDTCAMLRNGSGRDLKPTDASVIQTLYSDDSAVQDTVNQLLETGDGLSPFDTSCDITVIENITDASNLTDTTADQYATTSGNKLPVVAIDSHIDIDQSVGHDGNCEGGQTQSTAGDRALNQVTMMHEGYTVSTNCTTNIVGNLYMDTGVMFQMLDRRLSDLKSETDTAHNVMVEECLGVLRSLTTDGRLPTGTVGLAVNGTEGYAAGRSVVYAEPWGRDISLEAVCWRIRNRIAPYSVCVEKLLLPDCLTFWTHSRLYEALQGNVELFSQRDHVLRLIAIHDALVDERGEINMSLQRLIMAAFTKLPFHDQDHVAMLSYTERPAAVMTDNDASMLTAMFNRITVERDDEILSELLLLSLHHPTAVLRTAVEMCVKNDEQASNLAQVLQYLYEVCRCCHHVGHPETSLIGHVITEYLATTHLSDKEQKHFTTFAHIMMQPHKRSSGERKPSILSPLELIHNSVLPYTSVGHLLENTGPISCKFAMTLMKSALVCGCNNHCDWSEFRPMELVLCFAELMQECLVLWEHHHDSLGFVKISVRQIVSECLVSVGHLVRSGFVTVSDTDMEWFLAELHGLHWLAGVQLLPWIHPLSPDVQVEMSDSYAALIQEAVRDLTCNLVPILLSVGLGMDVDVAGMVDDNLPTYEDMVAALIQVLPNVLCEEFLAITGFIGHLVDSRLLPLCYRLSNTATLPLDDLSDLRRCLATSQLLRDTMVTLACVTDADSPMLQHTLQCYVANIKILKEKQTTSPDLQLFLIGQLFQHICEVTTSLPSSASDPVLVLLLHMLTEFKDSSAGVKVNTKGHGRASTKTAQRKGNSPIVNTRTAKCLTYGIEQCIQSLSDDSVEKEMLLKKLHE